MSCPYDVPGPGARAGSGISFAGASPRWGGWFPWVAEEGRHALASSALVSASLFPGCIRSPGKPMRLPCRNSVRPGRRQSSPQSMTDVARAELTCPAMARARAEHQSVLDSDPRLWTSFSAQPPSPGSHGTLSYLHPSQGLPSARSLSVLRSLLPPQVCTAAAAAHRPCPDQVTLCCTTMPSIYCFLCSKSSLPFPAHLPFSFPGGTCSQLLSWPCRRGRCSHADPADIPRLQI